MKVVEKTIPEIEAKLKTMSDFLRMEYLEECSKQKIDLTIKKFCNQELSKLYETRKMFPEAAKNMNSVAEMAVTYKEKIQAYMAEVGLWIKAGNYDIADEALQKAIAYCNAQEREELKKTIINIYKNQALAYEKANKNSNALKIYEKLLHMLSEAEKLEIKKKILPLYKRLGKIHEYTVLNDQIEKAG